MKSIVLYITFLFYTSLLASDIGSGNPRLTLRIQGDALSITLERLYSDRKEYQRENVISNAHAIRKSDSVKIRGGSSLQLYPAGPNSAFTCDAPGWSFMSGKSGSQPNRWLYEPRQINLLEIIDGQLIVSDSFSDIVKKFQLPEGAVFLGRIDNILFYWLDYDINKVFYRDVSGGTAYRINISKKVIDIFGVTRGVRCGYSLHVFTRLSGIFKISPYDTDTIEFDLCPK